MSTRNPSDIREKTRNQMQFLNRYGFPLDPQGLSLALSLSLPLSPGFSPPLSLSSGFAPALSLSPLGLSSPLPLSASCFSPALSLSPPLSADVLPFSAPVFPLSLSFLEASSHPSEQSPAMSSSASSFLTVYRPFASLNYVH